MRHALVLTLVLASGSLFAGEWQLSDTTVVRLASVTEGREALTAKNEFIERMSPTDRALRLRSPEPVSQEQYLRHVANQVLEFDDHERDKLGRAVGSLAKKLARWTLPWPEAILLVKTTGEEEGDAAYCRGAAIALPQSKLKLPGSRLEGLLAHELFHVLSNQNPGLRPQLYGIVGFEPCNEIELPPNLEARRITNPDAPTVDYLTQVEVDGEPVAVVPVLYSSSPSYDPKRGGNLFRYLTFRLLAVEQSGERWVPTIQDGEPVLFDARELPSYYQRIGRNTQYIIHPEEVLADNFSLLVSGTTNVATPRILKELDEALQGKDQQK